MIPSVTRLAEAAVFRLLILAQNDFSDIREIVRLPIIWPWLLAAAILLAGAAFLGWRRWRKAHTPTAPAEAVEPPHLKALRLLQALRDEGDQLDAERFTVEVSSILRIYLEEEIALPAPEQTSEEFLQQLRGQSWLTAELQRDIEEFMRVSDLVKFARQSIDADQRRRLLDSAVQVVETTRPPSQPEPVAG